MTIQDPAFRPMHQGESSAMRRGVDVLLRLGTVLVPLFLCSLACALPVSLDPGMRGDEQVQTGLVYAVYGWCGPLLNDQWGWYANLLLAPPFVLVALGRPRIAAAMASVALAFALSTVVTLRGASIPLDEGGAVVHHVRSFGAGYFAWLGAFVTTLAGSLALALHSNATAPSGGPNPKRRSAP
jgi:hypothetical protein